MTKRLLVANRSEIACRIFQTAQEMGLTTVALCATGDEEARHLTFADEVVNVASYLDSDAVVAAACAARVDLIHPGYGFLSERSHFARAVENAGIAFIGPTAETMDLMGGKIASKEIAERAKVPTLPWARVEQGGDIKTAAKKVGFPLLLKASAGGGGKGMRRVDRAEELLEAAESAAREAQSSFGDGTLFLERLVENPRHIEVQVFGDGRGHSVHLYERECSLQRRHQKVWEEARAPHLSESTREGLFTAALNLSREVKYRSAGTLEFLVNDAGEFFFLEMNTRLQVEHPVTELVTGTDLVRLQIEQALAPATTVLSETPSARGHAIEVRLYAEDPAQGFAPTPGKVEKLIWPMGPGIRVDSGIEAGQTIGTSFDSMCAKLIVSAANRDHAVARMQWALRNTAILGLGTNQSYLQAIAHHPQVIAGKVDTGFLGREFGAFSPPISPRDLSLVFAAKDQGILKNAAAASAGPAAQSSPWQSIDLRGDA